MLKTTLLSIASLSLMMGIAHADQSLITPTTAQSNPALSGSYVAANWGVKKVQVGTRKSVKKRKRVQRRKFRRAQKVRQHNFAVPGGFRLRRGGFNDDFSPGK